MGREGERGRSGARAGLLAGCLLASLVPAGAVVLRTQDDALAAAFPGAEVERVAEFLSEEQAADVSRRAGTELESRLVVRYLGRRDGEPLGTAYFETHLVRTLPETLLVLVSPQGRVARVEVLSFEEPRDYLPRERWFQQFDGRALDDDLALHRSIRGVTGATLSSRAVTEAVRRVLAIHEVLAAREPAADAEDGP